MNCITDKEPVPEAEPIAIALRAYARPKLLEGGTPYTTNTRRSLGPSEWSLVFDTETSTDAAQRLRFGTYQVYKAARLKEAGLFYNPEGLSLAEIDVIMLAAQAVRCSVLTTREFIDNVFLNYGYLLRATVVGMNLPFDISRIAIGHASARRKMRGGFSFQLCDSSRQPRVQVRHISGSAALIQFTHPGIQLTPRGGRRRGIKVFPHRGFFVDVKTTAKALTSRSFALAELCEHLNTKTRKIANDNHGAELTADYVSYAMNDVQATWECHVALVERYAQHGLADTPIHVIKSEASIGKAYLRQMNIASWRRQQPDFPPQRLGQIMSAYYGGRSEVRIRRMNTQVLYCDFLSMYPTVCTLMGLWRFVVAEGMHRTDTTEATRALLADVKLEDLQDQSFWKHLCTLVRVLPSTDSFPIRAKYGDEPQNTIALNYLSSSVPLWFTVADCIASKLLTGKAPEVIEAVSFVAGPVQAGLKPVRVGEGIVAQDIDPAKDDFYKALINLRSAVKLRMKSATGLEKSRLDAEQQAIKILANSTSYGIYIETIVETLEIKTEVECFGADGKGFDVRTYKLEAPGAYSHPLLAVLITGAARLMLATAETLADHAGLSWAFCDTDSMALSKPDGMAEDLFYDRARMVQTWFDPLNPYERKGPIFKLEDANYVGGANGQKIHTLYCFAISAKRYALFNIGADGMPIIRKASAHGLGHLMSPYEASNAPSDIPEPKYMLEELGVSRWQHDLWYQIVVAALQGRPDQPDLDFHPALLQPAMSRYGATAPNLLNWFKEYNRSRLYQDQVKPFGFLCGLHAKGVVQYTLEPDESSEGRYKSTQHVRPIAPYHRDPKVAASTAFNRETGMLLPAEALSSYRTALAQYHLHPEAKFHDGNYVDKGPTRRRHLFATSVIYIGKEADRLEEQFFLGADLEAEIDYGFDPAAGGVSSETIGLAIRRFGLRKMAKLARMSLRDVSRACSAPRTLSGQQLRRLLHVIGGDR